tara:strand:- start:164 stop:313 length:150 start_codon:yes stop_codon:yes gene_type:complete
MNKEQEELFNEYGEGYMADTEQTEINKHNWNDFEDWVLFYQSELNEVKE